MLPLQEPFRGFVLHAVSSFVDFQNNLTLESSSGFPDDPDYREASSTFRSVLRRAMEANGLVRNASASATCPAVIDPLVQMISP